MRGGAREIERKNVTGFKHFLNSYGWSFEGSPAQHDHFGILAVSSDCAGKRGQSGLTWRRRNQIRGSRSCPQEIQ